MWFAQSAHRLSLGRITLESRQGESLCQLGIPLFPIKSNIYRLCYDRASICFGQGAHDETLDWLQKGLALAEQMGSQSDIIRRQNDMGFVHYTRGAHDQALEWYRNGLTLAEEMDDRAEMARASRGIADVRRAQASYEQAQIQQARDAGRTQAPNEPAALAKTQEILDRLLAQRGQAEKPDKEEAPEPTAPDAQTSHGQTTDQAPGKLTALEKVREIVDRLLSKPNEGKDLPGDEKTSEIE